ncbi:MAG: histidine kinase [Cyclobacteriaceae bacterium]
MAFIISVVWISILSFIAVAIQSLFGLPFTLLSFKLSIGFTFRVNLFLHCINAIVTYHKKFSESEVAVEAARRESVNAKYDALRRQINPHFLFNSLNVLDGLIRINTDDASLFLERLSKVYRYLTLQEDRDLILLDEEVKFIESYIYLLEIRFKNNLSVNLNIEMGSRYHLVPSSLQMVLENAIKHNVISKDNPLIVEIFTEGSYLVVTNKLQPKATESLPSGIGLANIQYRYEFIGNEIPEVIDDGKRFTVKLPLIKLEDK